MNDADAETRRCRKKGDSTYMYARVKLKHARESWKISKRKGQKEICVLEENENGYEKES